MRKLAAVLAMGVVLLSGCSKKDNLLAPPATTASSAGPITGPVCPSPSAALTTLPTLPAGFPTPDELTLTGVTTAGPSAIVEGFWNGDITPAFEAWKSAFTTAGFDVTFTDKEAADAEVNFSGGGSSGQVKLETVCAGRTSVKITIRPA
jgi:hypothetical protein